MAPNDTQIREWLKALGGLVAPSITPKEFAGRINGLAAALAPEFPPAAFCPASLVHVARASKFFPNYAELCELLSPWWKEHRPPPLARVIASDQPATVTQREIERKVTESWQTITDADVRAKIRAIREGWQPELLGSFLATALRRHAPQHLGLLPPEWLKEPPRRDAA